MHAQFSTIGAGHDSDLPELWQWDDFTGKTPSLTAEQHSYAVQLGRYWGQFAATGGPNGAGLPEWRSFNDGCNQYLEPDHSGGPRTVPNTEYHQEHRFEFWSPLINPDPGEN